MQNCATTQPKPLHFSILNTAVLCSCPTARCPIYISSNCWWTSGGCSNNTGRPVADFLHTPLLGLLHIPLIHLSFWNLSWFYSVNVAYVFVLEYLVDASSLLHTCARQLQQAAVRPGWTKTTIQSSLEIPSKDTGNWRVCACEGSNHVCGKRPRGSPAW